MMIGRMAAKRNMSVRTPIEGLASIGNGGDVIDYLLDSEGLNYSSFVEVPSGIKRNQGRNDWYEAHLVDESGDGVIRYIELEASGDSPAFSDLKRHLKRHGSPINELFTVIAYRKSDEGPLTSPLNDDLTFLHIEEQFSSEDVEVTFDLNYFTVKRFGVEPAYFDYLDTLTVDSGQGRTSLEGDVEEVFSIREITRSFYQDFGEIFREDLQNAIHGLEDPEENLNAYTRTVVNRVLFLLFIEEKGWLDGDVDYVEKRYEEVAKADDMHVYDDLFEPLFFEALSEEGTTESDLLGRIPFLNGGLFERKDIEEDAEIDETFFDKLLSPEESDDGEPEGFLRRYKISLRESNSSEQELVVDPEFIGRIFEMFMQEDERSEVGAFYTPKPITAYMTKSALKQHLLGQTDITHEEAVSLVSDHTVPGSLSDNQIDDVDDALRSATVLDPAVGSGAFIIAMLEELVAVSEALDESTGDDRSRFQFKEEFIADTLYGVDIDAGGIELCKFRVWLHLMQDLDVDHEEFLDSNSEFALPNLGFKFFVGNSLVGEHDPTNVKARQETLIGGLDDTLEEIHRVRTEYQTTHGNKKDRLSSRIEELTDKLDMQLAIEESDWMTSVAKEADKPFAWTTNIPEVILNGGFDIVIGNPPYEGRSRSDYIKHLSHFYDDKYDFYKTIPRMRHDLYQKFIIRGWELTQDEGTLTFITSDTFLQDQSKQSTRNLLQGNEIDSIVLVNREAFDADVSTAAFTMRNTSLAKMDYNCAFLNAQDEPIKSYPPLCAYDWREDTGNDVGQVSAYSVPIEKYRKTLMSAFYEPTDSNLDIHSRFLEPVGELSATWSDEIRDSETLEENVDEIIENHISELAPGDISTVGLLTLGGQGLATGRNRDYMAYIEGSEKAEEIKQLNGPDFEYVVQNEETVGRGKIGRVITSDHIFDPQDLSKEQKLEGIDSEEHGDQTWVPVQKGFTKSDKYYSSTDIYINWSEESIGKMHDTGFVKNVDYFFQPGIYLPRGKFSSIAARYVDDAVIDRNVILNTIDNAPSTLYFIGFFNSEACQKITSTMSSQTSDIRNIPVVIPTAEEERKMCKLVEKAIEIKKGKIDESLTDIQDKIDELSLDIYDLGET